jgi:hypothetical protein
MFQARWFADFLRCHKRIILTFLVFAATVCGEERRCQSCDDLFTQLQSVATTDTAAKEWRLAEIDPTATHYLACGEVQRGFKPVRTTNALSSA